MTSKANLPTRVKRARAANQFVGRVKNGSGQDRFVVPGSNGRQYHTKIRKIENDSGNYITVQCWSEDGDCKGNSVIRRNGKEYRTVCVHGIATVIFMAGEHGLDISWCANKLDAVRLSAISEKPPFRVKSHQSGGVVFGVPFRGRK